MQIFLDSDPFDTSATTLGEVMAQVRDRLSDAGAERIIVEVRLDGRTVPSDELGQHHDAPLNVEELQLITANPRELARQTMLDVAEALIGARQAQAHAAELLRDDEQGPALDHVRTALGVWSQVQESVLHSAQLLGLSLDSVEVDGRTAPELVTQLAELLHLVREQIESADWLGLADTLEYDLAEHAGQWVELIQTLSEQIKGNS